MLTICFILKFIQLLFIKCWNEPSTWMEGEVEVEKDDQSERPRRESMPGARRIRALQVVWGMQSNRDEADASWHWIPKVLAANIWSLFLELFIA